jgi:hypothetical protein
VRFPHALAPRSGDRARTQRELLLLFFYSFILSGILLFILSGILLFILSGILLFYLELLPMQCFHLVFALPRALIPRANASKNI